MSKEQDDDDQEAWNGTVTPPQDISVEELTAFLATLGIIPGTALKCFADPLDPIPAAWVPANLQSPWKNEVNRLALMTVHSDNPIDGINCTDYASGCRFYGQVIYKKLNAGRTGALFEFAYEEAEVGEHDIVGVVSRAADRSLSLAFFEPQPNIGNSGFATQVLQPKIVTPDELKSCTDFRI